MSSDPSGATPTPFRRLSPSAHDGDIWQPPATAITAPLPPVAGPPSPQRRLLLPASPLALVGVGLAALLMITAAAGGYAAYRFFLGHDTRVTAGYAPTGAWAYAAVNTDPTSRAWLDAWSIARTTGVDDTLSGLPGLLLKQGGKDPSLWNGLLKPAIGQEVGVVVWPGASTDAPSVAAIMMLGDRNAAARLIPTLLDGKPLTPAAYRDVTYQVGASVAAGIVDDALVAASSEAAFQQVVDARRDGALDGVERFTQFAAASDRAAANPLAFAWIDTTAMQAAAGEALASDPAVAGDGGGVGMGVGMAGANMDVGIVTAAVKADAAALRGVMLTERQPANTTIPAGNAGAAYSAELPATSVFYAASSDFYASVWGPMMASMRQALGATSNTGMSDAPLAGLLDFGTLGGMFGIDPERDLLARMTGSWAVAVDVEPQGNAYAGGFRFVTQLDDEAAVRDALGTLETTLGEQGVPVRKTAGGFSVTQGDISGTVDVSGGALRVTLDYRDPSGGGTLANDPTFARAMATLPKDAAWIGYLAAGRLLDLLPADQWSTIDPQVAAALRVLDTVAFAASPNGAGLRADMVMSFRGD